MTKRNATAAAREERPAASATSVNLPAENVRMLEERGGQPDRSRGPLNQSAMLARHLDFYAGSLESSDPRASSGFPEAFFELTIDLLADPWQIRASHIEVLDRYLVRQRRFAELAARHRVDPAAYEAAIRALSYSQRIYLVDAAERRHAHDTPADPAIGST
jgi:hypothetical protein